MQITIFDIINKENMNTLELIKDSAFFGGNIPSDRYEEARELFSYIENILTNNVNEIEVTDHEEIEPNEKV